MDLDRLDPDAPITIGDEHLDTRVDLERGMSPAPPLTLALIALLTAVFARQVAIDSLASQEAIIAAGAKDLASIRAGEVWRLLSAAFLHGSAGHLVGNLVALYILGMAAEHMFGRARLASVLVLAAIAGSVFSCLDPRPSVGASGAIFGLMGAVAVAVYRNSAVLHVRDKRVGGALLVWAGWSFFIGIADPFVDNWAHLGGFVAGALAGGVAGLAIGPAAAGDDSSLRQGVLAASLLAVVYTLVRWLPRLA